MKPLESMKNFLPTTVPLPARGAVLGVQGVTLVVAFGLLVYVVGLSWLWFAAALLLALPAVAALWDRERRLWFDGARAAGLLGLVTVVAGGAADLWLGLLSQQPVDASLHLLVLLLGVLLAVLHHLLQDEAAGQEQDSVSGLLEAGLRGPPVVPMLCLALVLGGAVLAYLYLYSGSGGGAGAFGSAAPLGTGSGQQGILPILGQKLLQRGIIPPITLNLFLWGMALLAGKWLLGAMELKRQGSHLSRLDRAYRLSEREGDSQQEFAAALWQQFEAFYTLPRYIGWAIPILGFIGTVLGISLAAEGLAELLSNEGADFSRSLDQALRPLGIAFDTTLVALSLSVLFTLCQTLLYRWEERGLLRLTEGLRRGDAGRDAN